MARRTFKVSKRGMDAVECSADLPENLNDPLWENIVSNPDEDINDLALQSWVVKCQAGARNHLEKGPEAVQRFVDGYTYGARSGGFSAPSIDADEAAQQGFTAEQLAYLKNAGMVVSGLDSEDADAEAETAGAAG